MNGLLIGRFQPFHLGHLEALQFALSNVDNLWVGIGSSNKPNQKENPFSADERKEMILSSVDKTLLKRIKIFYIPDLDDHHKWIENIDKIVPKYELVFSNDELTQHIYSKRGVKVIPVKLKKRQVLSGTNIRTMITGDQNWEEFVPDGTKRVLQKIHANDRLKIL